MSQGDMDVDVTHAQGWAVWRSNKYSKQLYKVLAGAEALYRMYDSPK